MGSVADIIKTRTIIDSEGQRCLQTDCNTTWANNDFAKLYDLTFGQEDNAFNASRCSEVYVSAHNKLVYTSATSRLPKIFNKTLVDYCKKYKNDEWHMNAQCNGVYDYAFCEGMAQHGLTYRVRVSDKWNPGQTFDFYPAKMTDPRYTLMPMVVACQREDVPYSYAHFKSIIRVFTNIPTWHSNKINYDFSEETRDVFASAEKARNIFVSKQNLPLNFQILVSYYNSIRTLQNTGSFPKDTCGSPLKQVAKLFEDTDAGNLLTKTLFGCTAR